MRVFVSSSMDELASERKAIKEALDELKIEAWLFEVGAGARAGTQIVMKRRTRSMPGARLPRKRTPSNAEG